MKKTGLKLIALLMAALLASAFIIFAFASEGFEEDAYTNIVTFSDCQNFGPVAYNNFGRILKVMRDDGMPEPDSLIVGGDYSLLLADYSTPGVIQLREHYVNVYPGADADDIICAQGNHDQRVAAFYPSGMYDMGTYCLYLINEDNYPWRQSQSKKAEGIVRATADDIKACLDSMIAEGDTRPVILVTHVPLHYTTRTSGGDNKYASYVFDVLNEAGSELDIIFLFGHNHSGDYDDYIGGSVNFMAPGDTVYIPDPENTGIGGYTEETLSFTYTNCGYVGYNNNNATETSVNVSSLGAIRFFEDKFVFLKYTSDGLFREDEVTRINPADESDMGAEVSTAGMTRNNTVIWRIEKLIFEPLIKLMIRLFTMLGVV